MDKSLSRGTAIDITFFVACYDEEDNIVGTLDTLLAAVAELDLSWEILVIDDGSTDSSVELVRRYIQEHCDLPIYLKINGGNRGLAQNFIEGAFWGRGKYYRLICGDNVEPKETLLSLLNYVGRADLIIPYQETCYGKKAIRRAISRVFTVLVNLASGHNLRYYNGMPIFVRYHVMRWHTNYRGFGFQADMVTRLLDEGCSYLEVPRITTERITGKSKALNVINLCSVAHTLLDICIRRLGTALYYAERRGRLKVLKEELIQYSKQR